MLTSGCMTQAQDARQAAAALAEAVYPGRLEVIGASTRVGFDYGQRVVLGVRGDPVTRIRLSVDKDPSRCRVGKPCETRLREAYALAISQTARRRDYSRASRCGPSRWPLDGWMRCARRWASVRAEAPAPAAPTNGCG